MKTCQLLCLLLIGLSQSVVSAQERPVSERPRNVILFISDGCGPASFTLARDYLRFQGNDDGLAIDDVLVGSIHTYSTDSRVTDSAASATAYACGVKTYNGAIAVDTLQQPLATTLEAAEARGMATGLVATSRITHATPASFSAHVPDRDMESAIAEQQLDHGIEVIFGGGASFFLPEDENGLRTDGRNLLDEAEADGVHVVRNRDGFDAVTQLPVIGLFALSHMSYEIDRDPAAEPSLAEMTAKAIDLLKGDADGFFLMVEGSRIDHAGHESDAAAHLHEVLAFDDAIAEALDFARADGRTLVVSTSDHETGGLSLGRAVDGRSLYTWNPEVLAGVRASLGQMEEIIATSRSAPCDVLATYASITCAPDEEAAFAEAVEADTDPNVLVAEMIARRAVLGWTSTGHTAVDVNLYAYGPGRERFIGHHDNTAIGRLLAELMGFDLGTLTETLRQQSIGSE